MAMHASTTRSPAGPAPTAVSTSRSATAARRDQTTSNPAPRMETKRSPLSRRSSAIIPLGLPPAVPGRPLQPAVRTAIERGLGADLGGVTVHQDGPSDAAARSMGARAFAYGSRIFLGAGESAADLDLMAHESAHVLQQRGSPRPQAKGPASGAGSLESEANAAAQAVTAGSRFAVTGRTAGPTIQRQDQNDSWLRRAGRAVGSAVGSVVEFGEDVGWRMLQEFAPELVPIIRQGPVEWIKEKVASAAESVFNTLMAPIRPLTGIAANLVGHFANLVSWVRQAAARIANGDCGAVTEAAEKIQQVFEGLAAPVIDRIKQLADRVKGFFTGLWDRFGAPVWQFLQRIGGAAWERIQQLGRWIWEKTAPIRRVLDRAWTWIKNKLGIGEGAEGQDGILQWVQRKAQAVWDEHIKPFYERYRTQILVVTGVLIMLSPAGPVIAIAAAIGGLAAGIRWIRQYLRSREGIVRQRGVLEGAIIPGILGAVNRVSAFLMDKARFIAGKLRDVVGGLNRALGAVAGTVLNFAVSILRWIVDRFQELVDWAVQGLVGLASGAAAALERLRIYLQPILNVLREIAGVVGNLMRLPMLLAGRLWNAIPACIRNPFVDFFIPLILRQIAFFRELAASPEAWRQTRTQVMDLIHRVFRNFDLLGAIRGAFALVVRALRIPVDLMGQLLDKAASAWDAVIAAPIRFIETALKAILQGVGRFMRNILSHLWFGVQGWLFNAVNQSGGRSGVAVSPPTSWTDFRAVFGFVLGVLGISVNHVIELINRRVPGAGRVLQAGVRLLSGALEWIKIAIEQGPRGLWQHLVQRLSDLGTLVLESAVGWVMTRVVAIVGARLAAMAASAGLTAVLEAVKAVYSAIQTAIEYMPRILAILIRVFDTVNQIAAGVIGPAATLVEGGFRMAMPIIIGFLANYAGLGGIGGRIVEIIQNVRQRIDDAILGLIDRVIAAIRSFVDTLRRGARSLAAAILDRPVRFAGERHRLRAQTENGPVAVVMASDGFRDVHEQLVLLRRNYLTQHGGELAGQDEAARALDERLRRVLWRKNEIIDRAGRDRDRRDQILSEGLGELEDMVTELGEYMVETFGQALGPGARVEPRSVIYVVAADRGFVVQDIRVIREGHFGIIAQSLDRSSQLFMSYRSHGTEWRIPSLQQPPPYVGFSGTQGAGTRIAQNIQRGVSPGGGYRATPPGYSETGRWNQRGHLVAREFGGPGDLRNIVAMTTVANQGPTEMRSVEIAVSTDVAKGTVLTYKATPIYNGKSPFALPPDAVVVDVDEEWPNRQLRKHHKRVDNT